MENKINIAELLKDCPSGMELDCTLLEGLEFDDIIDNEYLPIRCRVKNPNGGYNVYNFTKYGCWFTTTFAKCVIFPKGKTTWEGFVPPCRFKDGDIISNDRFIAIFHRIDKPYNCVSSNVVYYHCFLNIKHNEFKAKIDYGIGYIEEYKYATEKEKQKLFDAIKDNGYKWNAETKTLGKLIKPKFKVGNVIQDIDTYKVKITEVNIEDECYEYESMIAKGIGSIDFNEQNNWELVPNKFDINTLKPFDKVLVRNAKTCVWTCDLYSHYSSSKPYNFVCTSNAHQQCIPYNDDTKYLLGTTNDCDNYYKNWE